jgi:hypothetical protein
MTGYDRIEWYQWIGSEWKDFLSVKVDRYVCDNNQTAALQWPFFTDSAEYKCVGYGSNGNINQRIKLTVKDYMENTEPFPLYPPDYETTLEQRPPEGGIWRIPCRGFYGTLETCDHCEIGWVKMSGGTQTNVANDTSQQIYSVTKNIYDDNAIECTLYINGLVSHVDYSSQFTCWMANGHYRLDKARFVRFLSPADNAALITFKVLFIISGTIVVLLVVVGPIYWRHGLRFKRYIKERFRTPFSSRPDVNVKYDALLVNFDYDNKNSLGFYLCARLNERTPYSTLHFPDGDSASLMPLHEAFVHQTKQCLCTIFLVSRQMMTDVNHCFCLNNCVTATDFQNNIIFILFGGLRSISDASLSKVLTETVLESIRLTRRYKVIVWPVSDTNTMSEDNINYSEEYWTDIERRYRRQVDKFWNQLRIAIPNQPRQKLNCQCSSLLATAHHSPARGYRCLECSA